MTILGSISLTLKSITVSHCFVKLGYLSLGNFLLCLLHIVLESCMKELPYLNRLICNTSWQVRCWRVNGIVRKLTCAKLPLSLYLVSMHIYERNISTLLFLYFSKRGYLLKQFIMYICIWVLEIGLYIKNDSRKQSDILQRDAMTFFLFQMFGPCN